MIIRQEDPYMNRCRNHRADPTSPYAEQMRCTLPEMHSGSCNFEPRNPSYGYTGANQYYHRP